MGVRSRASRVPETLDPEAPELGLVMEDDFVDVFPSTGGVGDSPVRTSVLDETLGTSPWPKPSISLSIPGLDTGGAAAAVSPAIPGSHGVATPSPAKEAVLRSTRSVGAVREEDDMESPVPSPLPFRLGLAPALTIDPGGDCVPTELEKKRAKLERFRYECSEVCRLLSFGLVFSLRYVLVRKKKKMPCVPCSSVRTERCNQAEIPHQPKPIPEFFNTLSYLW